MKMAFKINFGMPSFLKSVKYCLGVVNIVFLITGIMLAITGIVVLSCYSSYEGMITNRFFNIPGLAVATGALIFLATLLGFYGALSQKFYVIVTYVGFLIAVLALEFALVVASFSLRNDAPTAIRSSMLEHLKLYSLRLDVARIWDELQTSFECCGVAGRYDYISHLIPVSCCHMDYGTISPFECSSLNAYSSGCSDALGEWLAGKANALAVVALICTCIQVLVTCASGWLAWRSKFAEVELEH